MRISKLWYHKADGTLNCQNTIDKDMARPMPNFHIMRFM